MNHALFVLGGALITASTISALFFLRFWSRTRDRLFLYFSLAFFLLSINWLLLAITDSIEESTWYFYIFRLAAFLIILLAIADKNRSAKSP